MLLLKYLLPWQLLVLPQIKHVHVVSEHQKQAENQEKVYWTNPWSWSLALFLDCQQYYFLLCFHLRFKYKGREDCAIRNANFSTTKPQSAGLCFGGDCGPYKWLTFVSSKLLDCLQFVLIANTCGDWEKAQIIQYKYTGHKNVLVIAKAGGGNWMKHARIKKQERKVMYGAKKRATHSHIWYHRKMVSSLTPWWKTPTTSNPPNSLQSFTTALHAWRRAWRTSRLQGP